MQKRTVEDEDGVAGLSAGGERASADSVASGSPEVTDCPPGPMLRVLVLAPDCNPESVTTPQIAYAHADALGRQHSVTLVLRGVNAPAVQRARGSFQAIEAVHLPWLDRLYGWAIRRIFKFDYGRQSLTAATYPLQIAFEWRAWRQLRRRIRSGEFDVVLRILPIVPVLPSPFAWFLRNGPIPFVLGPLNGGLPWPEGFPQLDKQRSAAGYWVSNLRSVYRYLPFAHSTFAEASAIIAGSSHTCAEFDVFRHKVFFVPGENGIDPVVLGGRDRHPGRDADPLRLAFVGRLIPLKACDLALRGAASLLREGRARFTVIGDGPERQALEQLAASLEIAEMVEFTGWISPPEVLTHLQSTDVLVFPSLREFGGGVIFEALGLGAVPVVADFGGPGDIVTPEIGFRLPLRNADDLVRRLEAALTCLAGDRACLERLRRHGMAYARAELTWDGKARTVSSVLAWATGRGPKPVLLPPRRSGTGEASAAHSTTHHEADGSVQDGPGRSAPVTTD